jgi:hypothetical protein
MDYSIGNGNDTFFMSQNTIKKDQSTSNVNNTKMTDVSKEFGEYNIYFYFRINKDIFNALQEKSQDRKFIYKNRLIFRF